MILEINLSLHSRETERETHTHTHTQTEIQRLRETVRKRDTGCAIASACKHYRYCDQTYAAKHFSSGNVLIIYYKAANHFIT